IHQQAEAYPALFFVLSAYSAAIPVFYRPARHLAGQLRVYLFANSKVVPGWCHSSLNIRLLLVFCKPIGGGGND
ncbi:MAG: hypothetical protein WBN48_22065, partial [Thiogranum sp.]